MSSFESRQPNFGRVQVIAWSVGVGAMLFCAMGWMSQPDHFYQSYLFAFLFWIGISIGSAEVLMLHHVVGGDWGLAIRRLLEAGSRTIWLMLLLFLPILIGLRHLYVWANPDIMARDPELQQKAFYLNVPFFYGRMALYFFIWGLYAYLLNRWSARSEQENDPAWLRRLQAISGPGMAIYGLAVTFAGIDLAMSLEPHWNSTIYGFIFLVGEVLSTLCLAIFVAMLLSKYQEFKAVTSAKSFNDLGNLLLTFVILWAYMAVSQLIIVWSGNLQDEIPWYLRRVRGGWGGLVLPLAILHFAVPFLLLLSRAIKRRVEFLGWVAFGVLVMQLVDTYWLVEPALRRGQFQVTWLDIATTLGVGGLWVGTFCWHAKSRPLIPRHDPQIEKFIGEAERA